MASETSDQPAQSSHDLETEFEKNSNLNSAQEVDEISDLFSGLHISAHDVLERGKRMRCSGKCGKQRRYYCSECIVFLLDQPCAVPNVKLPLRIHILQSGAEHPQRSTAQHVPLLAPDWATVWRPHPECISDFRAAVIDGSQPGSIAVLYPSEGALLPEEAATQLPGLRDLVVIDATWTKSTLMLEEPWLNNLPKVALPSGTRSLYWRYAPSRGKNSRYFSPDKVDSLLSTVEAIHRFCEAYGCANGCAPGACDDLLWLFTFLHRRIRDIYETTPAKRARLLRKSKGLMYQF